MSYGGSTSTSATGIQVTFLDQTGSKSVKAVIAPSVPVSRILPNIITKMVLPTTSPDGQPMSYALDHKEGGRQVAGEPDAAGGGGAGWRSFDRLSRGGRGLSRWGRLKLGGGDSSSCTNPKPAGRGVTISILTQIQVPVRRKEGGISHDEVPPIEEAVLVGSSPAYYHDYDRVVIAKGSGFPGRRGSGGHLLASDQPGLAIRSSRRKRSEVGHRLTSRALHDTDFAHERERFHDGRCDSH